MRIFALCTGRCGSVTLSKALEYTTNYTTGHETLAGEYGERRWQYPDKHIEIDNRLSWMLGSLARYENEWNHDQTSEGATGYKTAYIWLRRKPDDVAKSFFNKGHGQLGRNEMTGRLTNQYSSVVLGWWEGILQREEKKVPLAAISDMVETITRNIEEFLSPTDSRHPRPYHTIWIDQNPKTSFSAFWKTHRLEGDLDAALKEFDTLYNKGT